MNKINIPLTHLDCLAKTYYDNFTRKKGCDVYTHCVVTGLVAMEIVRKFHNCKDFGFDSLNEIGLSVALHDIGKVSPGFQEKIIRSVGETLGFSSDEFSLDPDKKGLYCLNHAETSQACLKRSPSKNMIAIAAGRHHGYSPEETHPVLKYDSIEFGDSIWVELRDKLVEDLKKFFSVKELKQIKSLDHLDLFTGLMCVSDWISSGNSFFGVPDQKDSWFLPEKIQEAIDLCGFVGFKTKPISFYEAFEFERNKIQETFSSSVIKPGMYILEASMGEGKTEAALWSAYNLLHSSQAKGIYFALPTQATATQMLDRMNKFLEKICSKDSGHSISKITHSSSIIIQDFGADGGPGGSWYDNSKNALLTPFGVGTVDQAMMAVMNVKFNGVRSFALKGKVVIIDEVHSYDAYMGSIIKELSKYIIKNGGSVVLLSATLNDKSLEYFTGEYPKDHSYPKMTSLIDENVTEAPLTSIAQKKIITVEVGEHNILEEAVKNAENGAQVLIIKNTVNESMEIYKECLNKLGPDRVGLLHSRFTMNDRSANESKWIGLFGKGGSRNEGRILVGTQVLEQSLDIDSDIMYTDLCPIDMIWQRTGRLHRHNQNLRPVGFENPKLIINVPESFSKYIDSVKDKEPTKDLKKKIQGILKGSSFVYDIGVLVKTFLTVKEKVFLDPSKDMRETLNRVYDKKVTCLKDIDAEVETNKKELENRSRTAFSNTSGETKPDDERACTRIIDGEPTIPVLLLKGIDTSRFEITTLDGIIHTIKQNEFEKNLLAIILGNTIKVKTSKAPETNYNDVSFLKKYMFFGKENLGTVNKDSMKARVGILSGKDVLTIHGDPVGNNTEYTSNIGYSYDRQKK